MKKGLIELRTGRVYIPGIPKEEYEDEAVNEGFDVDYESFKEGEYGKDGEGKRLHSQKNCSR